jgi:hypothetical protein
VWLLACGPLLGLGGQARAGFVATSVDGAPGPETPRWHAIARDFLQGANLPAAPQVPSTSGPAAEEAAPPAPPSPVPGPPDVADLGGAGSTSPAPSGPGGPVTFLPGLSSRPALAPLTRAGLLVLAEPPSRPCHLASRLFRPPRS